MVLTLAISLVVLLTAVICFVLGASVQYRSSRGLRPLPPMPLSGKTAVSIDGEDAAAEAKPVTPPKVKL